MCQRNGTPGRGFGSPPFWVARWFDLSPRPQLVVGTGADIVVEPTAETLVGFLVVDPRRVLLLVVVDGVGA